ncbi:PTS lactose/cellobiose transporter subunit IIA [Facklamia sp. DSM 111018]|uniref:PTS lactose/cellobiose transporter subunit IIA n=1 Tax=Facklamia lactis TaxID=2749967 RepID=A0ABS0LVJ9_9LACT|nr:PTS lactose/cellobiose transporter subunit IIA [Facklamia lactis]MBG9979454.1 PTS lactose/cellobiose transporter subunit IIA [Facklamia lactis]MBG9987319.1 PTS lactose/cellobiose transporter subunit IIA [Facklamia lactis]
MNEVEKISFKMISALGGAKSSFMEAINFAKEFDFEQADKLIEEGSELLKAGHDVHFELLTKEANKEAVELSVLLIHAEDQLMSAELLKIMAEEWLNNYKMLQEIKEK